MCFDCRQLLVEKLLIGKVRALGTTHETGDQSKCGIIDDVHGGVNLRVGRQLLP